MAGQISPSLPIYLGCPVWNCEHWDGVVFPAKTPKRQWLGWYSKMFNTSEGNSSFYGIPSTDVAQRWASEVASGFRFCMKFPKVITHERELVHAEAETAQFLAALEVLARADCLGPSFLQLGPSFAAERLATLKRYLESLPTELPLAVEVRHLSWFDQAANEQRLDDLLRERGIDRVLFDSRPLYQAPPSDPIEAVSQTRKPKSPHRTTVTGPRPMLRLIGRNQIEMVDPFLDEWSPIIASWVARGLTPYVFTHAPDDQFAPALAKRLWDRVRTHLPSSPGPLPSLPKQPQQLGLFD